MPIKPMSQLPSYLQGSQAGWQHENLSRVHDQLAKLAETVAANIDYSMGDLNSLKELPDFNESVENLQTAVSETEDVLDAGDESGIVEYRNLPSSEVIAELLDIIEMTPAEREAYLSNKTRDKLDAVNKLKEKRALKERKYFDRPADIEGKLLVVIEALAHILEVTAAALTGTQVEINPELIDHAQQYLNEAQRQAQQNTDGVGEMSLDQMVIFEDLLRSSVLEPYLRNVAHMLNTTWEKVAVGALELKEKNEEGPSHIPPKPSPFDK